MVLTETCDLLLGSHPTGGYPQRSQPVDSEAEGKSPIAALLLLSPSSLFHVAVTRPAAWLPDADHDHDHDHDDGRRR